MKVSRNIAVAFILNLAFSGFEFIGGLFTNSVAIMSDAIHDFGDALSIGMSYFFEKKSKKDPDNNYTYGYIRYSILGAMITTIILFVGSILVIVNAVNRLFNPVDINYDGMIVFAIVGVIVNFIAAYTTKGGNSLNQRAVNLHMLEDVLGWIVVLIGAIVMRFTDITIIDSIMSILVAIFILKNSFINISKILDLFLEKVPNDIKIEEIKSHILEIKNVLDVHHIHIWSIDGYNNYATMHVVVKNNNDVKKEIREELKEHGISHVTIEIEKENENCKETNCNVKSEIKEHTHHHHH